MKDQRSNQFVPGFIFFAVDGDPFTNFLVCFYLLLFSNSTNVVISCHSYFALVLAIFLSPSFLKSNGAHTGADFSRSAFTLSLSITLYLFHQILFFSASAVKTLHQRNHFIFAIATIIVIAIISGHGRHILITATSQFLFLPTHQFTHVVGDGPSHFFLFYTLFLLF